MYNPIVETLAHALNELSCERNGLDPSPFGSLPSTVRQELRQQVHDVLLAAMKEGYVLHKIDTKRRVTEATPVPGKPC